MTEAKLKSRDEVVESNLGLVHSCAHRFKGRGIEYDDLFQAGCMGLIKATDAFDYSRGVRFSTYAVPVILGEMRRLFRDGGTVKVSRTLKELSMKVSRERERITQKTGREPTISELAGALDIDPAEVSEALGAALPPISLTEAEEDGGGQYDIPVVSHEEELADILSLKEVVSSLEPRDRQLIVLRYFCNKTQTQTADLLSMTQVQVSRREKKILSALRRDLME
ncbi:MAG: sigma-70 family RNA polymerase sigma factor [Acetanaerobacterium sp.]